MPEPPPDEFTRFVAQVEPELRYAAGQKVGDPGKVDRLMRDALAATARNWRFAYGDDPVTYVLEALDAEANALWRNDSDDADSDSDDPGRPTGRSLAQEAWQLGARLRRRRRRTGVIAAAIAAVLVGTYVWTLNMDAGPPPAPQPIKGQVTAVSSTLAVLPPPGMALQSDLINHAVPQTIDIQGWSPNLSNDPVDEFVLAYQIPGRPPEVIGTDGQARLIDGVEATDSSGLFARSVSVDGKRIAVVHDDEILLVGTAGDVETVALPDSVTAVTDLAWYPDGAKLLLTAADGTVALDLDNGKAETVDWYGSATTFSPDDAADPVEYLSTQDTAVTLRNWHTPDDPSDLAVPRTAALPTDNWVGAPFADDTGYIRACVPSDDADIPVDYGEPAGCVAVLSPDGEVDAVLVSTDDYRTDIPPSVLATRSNQVYFTMPTRDGADQTILVWQTASGALNRLTTIDNRASVALGAV